MSLTTKELTCLKEQLGGEQILIKKFTKYAEMCTDSELKTKLNAVANKHQEHYNTLLNQLK